MKPRVFIASSVEGLDIAYAMQENLDHEVDVTVWPQGIFAPSSYALDDLLAAVASSDFGIFVFTPDDVLIMRDNKEPAVRDNVLFELGLFIGRLGKSRNYFVVPNNAKNLHMPTDLWGLNPLKFNSERSDGNLKAALGAACNKLRTAVKKLGPIVEQKTEEVPEAATEEYDERDILAMLESWMGNRHEDDNTSVIHYTKVDKELGLCPGSTENYIEVAAHKWGYRVAQKGSKTIRFDKVHYGPTVISRGIQFPRW